MRDIGLPILSGIESDMTYKKFGFLTAILALSGFYLYTLYLAAHPNVSWPTNSIIWKANPLLGTQLQHDLSAW